MKKNNNIISIISIFLFTGCQNLYNDQNNVARNLNSSLSPLVIDIVGTLYPFLAFIGLIILSVSIYTLFIKPGNGQETPVSKLLMGVLEFSLAVGFIMSKSIVESIFGK